MSNSSETDHHSVWNDTGYCDCSAMFYEVLEIEWTTHSMGIAGRVAWNIIRIALIPVTLGGSAAITKSYTHEAIWLLVHCRKCGCDMNLTCELSKTRKMMRWGYYGYYITRREYKKLEPRLNYNTVKKIYDGMWEKYNVINRNCFQWADNFYDSICDEECYNGWKNTRFCDCSANFYEIFEIEWKTYSIGHRPNSDPVLRSILAMSTGGLLPFVTAAAGGRNYTQEAVLLCAYCRNCKCDMDITCELTKSGKKMLWGYHEYFTTCKNSKEFKPRLSYNTIKDVFDGMWQSHDGNKGCEWAKDFYGKIIDKS
ncbi:unnamed protein product [Meloidogyne enterolobii]|uniref:Uncharacterized protein n=1 Tax=Meloidogyne enterolobii TaxID=390850 RepID=A0ACB1AJE6_MELEN